MKKGYDYSNTSESALMKIRCEYMQEQDSESDTQIDNTLEIWTENAGTDEPYLCFKTERFAVDDIDELISIFTDFKSRYDL